MIIYKQKNIQCILCILYIQDTFIQEYGPPDVPPLSIQCENQERRYNETNGNSNQDHQPTFFTKINIDEVKTKDINQLFQYGYYQVKTKKINQLVVVISGSRSMPGWVSKPLDQ